MRSKDIVFKIVSGLVLLIYGMILLSVLSENYYFERCIFSDTPLVLYIFIVLIIGYYLTFILFVTYLNKFKSDKWIILTISIQSVFLVIITIFYLISHMTGNVPHYMDYEYLIMSFLSVLLLAISLFTIYCFLHNYKYKVANYIILIVGIFINFFMTYLTSSTLESVIIVFIQLINFINFLYLWLAKKGVEAFINRNRVYQNLIKAKNLLEQNIITNEEYETIRLKYVKYL